MTKWMTFLSLLLISFTGHAEVFNPILHYSFSVDGRLCVSPSGWVCWRTQDSSITVEFDMPKQLEHRRIEREIKNLTYHVELKA